jgi:hypothetical protein
MTAEKFEKRVAIERKKPQRKPIGLALKEAHSSLLQIAILTSAVDTLVVYLLGLLVCLLFTLPNWYAVVPAFAYAIIHTRGNLQQVSFAKIEERVPALKERLTTVADNWKDDNPVIDQLNAEVLLMMKEIRTSYFLDFGRLSRELLVMLVVSFIIIGSSAFNVKFLDIGDAVKEIRDFRPGEYDINEELLEYEEGTNLSEILGEKSINELGKQQLDLQLNPLKSDVVIGKIRDPEERSFREVPPREILAQSDSSYQDDIPKQYQKIVKTYFNEITKT